MLTVIPIQLGNVAIAYIHKIMWRAQFLKRVLVLFQIARDRGDVPKEEMKQQVNRRTNRCCPPQGTLNKIITDGM